MRKLAWLSICAVFLLSAVGPVSAGVPPGWEEVGTGSASGGGGISANDSYSDWPSLAVAPDGTPYVSWRDTASGADEIYVRRWNGAGWEAVGAPIGACIASGNPYTLYRSTSLVVAPDGTPHIAWHDCSSGGFEIYVRRWNGATWEEVGAGSASGGGISDSASASWGPSLAIDLDGTPYVTWYDYSGGDAEIYVRRWNGSIWEEVGTGSATGGGISNNDGSSEYPSLAIAPDGMPTVAWSDGSSGNYEIYVRHWNGFTWEEMGAGSASGGGISNNSGVSDWVSLALAPDGTAYLTWRDDSSGNYEIYVRRWNGFSWEEVGAGSATGGGISNNSGNSHVPSLAISPDGTPYIAWQDDIDGDYDIYAMHWNGSIWDEVGTRSISGGISDDGGLSALPSIAVAPDGMPYVAWEDDSSGDMEIYVRRWNGTSWEEVGTGSASGGGISNNAGISEGPSLAIGPDGVPYIAWHDNSAVDYEIYVRRWNGTNWEEVGAGSASGGGISDNS
jgi:hypothetical protein